MAAVEERSPIVSNPNLDPNDSTRSFGHLGSMGFKSPMESARVRKNYSFIVIFSENSKNFVIFTKSSNKFGKFLNFLGFSKIFIHFLVFSYVFLNFLDFSRML